MRKSNEGQGAETDRGTYGDARYWAMCEKAAEMPQWELARQARMAHGLAIEIATKIVEVIERYIDEHVDGAVGDGVGDHLQNLSADAVLFAEWCLDMRLQQLLAACEAAAQELGFRSEDVIEPSR